MQFLTHLLILCLSLMSAGSLYSQNPNLQGTWKGTILAGNQNLDLYLNFTYRNNGWSCSLDVPVQGLSDMEAQKVEIDEQDVIVGFTALIAEYRGQYQQEKDVITGEWHQSGQVIALDFTRSDEKAGLNRPQEPQEPFPYESVEVTFPCNSDTAVVLAGTLTYPSTQGPFTGVVLVSGSGPQNRNEELAGHKPFLILADSLTRAGYAVLRYDDRGTGKSTGNFQSSTTFDFSEDALGALSFLKSQDHCQVKMAGILGHSEGGIAGIISASGNANVDFLILLASPGVSGKEVMVLQNYNLGQLSGASEEQSVADSSFARRLFDLIPPPGSDTVPFDSLKKVMSEYYASARDRLSGQYKSFEQFYFTQSMALTSPWYRQFIHLDPQEYLLSVHCPVLALNGSLDSQVDAEQNLGAIEAAFATSGHKNYQIVELDGLNHLFQQAQTGGLDEYATIEETINSRALKVIVNWLQNLDL